MTPQYYGKVFIKVYKVLCFSLLTMQFNAVLLSTLGIPYLCCSFSITLPKLQVHFEVAPTTRHPESHHLGRNHLTRPVQATDRRGIRYHSLVGHRSHNAGIDAEFVNSVTFLPLSQRDSGFEPPRGPSFARTTNFRWPVRKVRPV